MTRDAAERVLEHIGNGRAIATRRSRLAVNER